MREQDVFVLADRALNDVVQQIDDDQWATELPPTFRTARSGPVTLREVVNYHACDDAWVPDMLAGRTMAEVGTAAFKGDLLGDEPKAAFAALVARACEAARSTPDLTVLVHCSFGDYTAQQYLWQVTSFRGLRAHDLAEVIGVDCALPPDLVQGMWEQLEPVADEWRTYGVFGPRVEVPPDAPLLDQLLGLTGRQPDHPAESGRGPDQSG